MCGKRVGRAKPRPLHAYHRNCQECLDRALDAGYVLTIVPNLSDWPVADDEREATINDFKWTFKPTKITIAKVS